MFMYRPVSPPLIHLLTLPFSSSPLEPVAPQLPSAPLTLLRVARLWQWMGREISSAYPWFRLDRVTDRTGSYCLRVGSRATRRPQGRSLSGGICKSWISTSIGLEISTSQLPLLIPLPVL